MALAEDFLRSCNRQHKPTTARLYGSHLEVFASFCEERGVVAAVEHLIGHVIAGGLPYQDPEGLPLRDAVALVPNPESYSVKVLRMQRRG